MYKLLNIVILGFLMTSCASVKMLPQDVSKVDFNEPEGKTGWSQYKQTAVFHGYTVDQVYEAAKVGLGSAGFSIRTADKSKGMVIGEHGMTAHDWNVIAGVYFQQTGNDTQLKIITEGSKDIGFSGDVTGDGWSGKVIKGMQEYLNNTYQAILKVDKSDIK